MKPKLKPLAEQVILITGASSGIGLATAREAAERGAQVVLVARNEDALKEIVAGIEAKGGSAAYAVSDVGDIAAVRAAAYTAISRFGRIDTWVNCAGVTIYAPLAETPLDEHERMIRTNYFGVVHGCIVALEHMRESGGALITVGSIVSDIPTAVLGAYAATKHAAKGYVESLRLELASAKVPVSVTLVKPSGIDTPIGAHAANHGAGEFHGEARIPPPVYKPEIVANAILACAERPRREITVGGIGRAQALFGMHFPGLLDRLGGLLVPLLFDPKRRPTPTDSLEQAAQDGQVHSDENSGRSFSLYTSAALHRGALLAGLVGVSAAIGLLALSKRRP